MKYKLWCKNKNEWEKDSWVILPNGNIAWTECGNIVGCANPKNHTLVRSIGLKDKNGKEIYEGDIIGITPNKDRRIEGQVIGVIECRNFGLCLNNKVNYCNRIYEVHKFEIIGNIYENPELLERE